MTVTVFLHLYYDASWQSLKSSLTALPADWEFFINISNEDFSPTVLDDIRKTLTPVIIRTSNVGKDIGGKLAMLDTYFKLQHTSDFFVFLHDKISPHAPMGEAWRQKLFKIIDPQIIPTILTLFRERSIGMIGAKDHVITRNMPDELVYATNGGLLKTLMKEFEISAAVPTAFVGGTMFWVRASIYEKFFKTFSPLTIRATLEKGNVMDHGAGTNTHSWERLLGWIVGSAGYNVQGI